jgi:hypothetical protein
VIRQTVQNETRERAIRDLQRPLTALPIKDLATLAGERHLLTSLARQTGQSLATLLDALWSSDITEMRAAALIEQAQHEIAQEFAEQERKRARRSTGRRR